MYCLSLPRMLSSLHCLLKQVAIGYSIVYQHNTRHACKKHNAGSSYVTTCSFEAVSSISVLASPYKFDFPDVIHIRGSLRSYTTILKSLLLAQALSFRFG